jgi:hypothetical protein
MSLLDNLCHNKLFLTIETGCRFDMLPNVILEKGRGKWLKLSLIFQTKIK